MFSLGNYIREELKNLREELGLTKVELARLSEISAKTIYQLETGKRKGKIETFVKIRNALKESFNIDLFAKAGIKIIWDFKDLNQNALNIIEGGLLGDGCISKHGVYLQEAKDKKYLEWLGKLLNKNGIKYKIVPTKSKSSYSKSRKPFYRLYTYYCPAFLELQERWYISSNKGKRIKRIPNSIKLTPTTLLHWYLGDGNFKRDRRKPPKGGRPCIRMCTDGFLKKDIELLLKKLKETLGLTFYPLPKLNKDKERGYILHLYPRDLFKFFELIGLNPPQEIEDSITKEFLRGKMKGLIFTFKEKWPNEVDWIKILAKTESVGKILKEKRKKLGLTQRKIAEKVGVTKHHITEIEAGRKYMSLKCFKKVLEILKIDINKLLDNVFILNKKNSELVKEN